MAPVFQDGKECVVKEVVPGDSVNSLLSILDVITVSEQVHAGYKGGRPCFTRSGAALGLSNQEGCKKQRVISQIFSTSLLSTRSPGSPAPPADCVSEGCEGLYSTETPSRSLLSCLHQVP